MSFSVVFEFRSPVLSRDPVEAGTATADEKNTSWQLSALKVKLLHFSFFLNS